MLPIYFFPPKLGKLGKFEPFFLTYLCHFFCKSPLHFIFLNKPSTPSSTPRLERYDLRPIRQLTYETEKVFPQGRAVFSAGSLSDYFRCFPRQECDNATQSTSVSPHPKYVRRDSLLWVYNPTFGVVGSIRFRGQFGVNHAFVRISARIFVSYIFFNPSFFSFFVAFSARTLFFCLFFVVVLRSPMG